jgi:sulfur-carrier protein
MPAVKVRIPEVLRKLTNNQEQVALEAGTIQEVIDNLEKAHPGIKERICDEKGQVRRFVNVYVNEEDIRFLENLDTKLEANADVSIVPAVAGG